MWKGVVNYCIFGICRFFLKSSLRYFTSKKGGWKKPPPNIAVWERSRCGCREGDPQLWTDRNEMHRQWGNQWSLSRTLDQNWKGQDEIFMWSMVGVWKKVWKVFLICCWLVVVMATVECLHIPSCFIEESNSKEGLTFIPGCNWWGVQPSKLRCYCGCVYLVIWTSFFHAYHRKNMRFHCNVVGWWIWYESLFGIRRQCDSLLTLKQFVFPTIFILFGWVVHRPMIG